MSETTLADLKPDPRNARRHNPRNIGMIVDSLHQVGAARSIVIDEDNVILAGNGVVDAAAEAGIMDVRIIEASGNEIIAVKRSGLSDEQKVKLALFDNRTAELADWDIPVLDSLDIDLGGLWFDSELAEMGIGLDEQPEDPGPQIDKAAELQEKWQVERGQVWEIGKHRLMCGDSTCAEDVGRLMGGEKADILHADPPYGISLLTKRASLGKSKQYNPVAGDDAAFDPRPFLGLAQASVFWGANHYASRLPDSPCWLVWDKQGGAKDTTFATCELAWCSLSKPARVITHVWDGWRRDSEKDVDRVHPNQKPVEVIKWALSWFDGMLIADLWLGSGTTMVACENLGRVCFGLEIEPRYCAVVLERMSGMGLEPRLSE